jgi:hypothetical protein
MLRTVRNREYQNLNYGFRPKNLEKNGIEINQLTLKRSSRNGAPETCQHIMNDNVTLQCVCKTIRW